MASFTLSMTAVVDGVAKTVSRSAIVDDAVAPTFFAAYRDAYGQIQDGVDKGGNPMMRDMTDEEVFNAYAKGIAQGTIANVQRYAQDQAQKTAVAQVPTLSYTPGE